MERVLDHIETRDGVIVGPLRQPVNRAREDDASRTRIAEMRMLLRWMKASV